VGAAYQPPRLLILLNVNGLVQIVDTLLAAPVFSVGELLQGILRVEAAGTEEAATVGWWVSARCRVWDYTCRHPRLLSRPWETWETYSIVSSSWLASTLLSGSAGV
jgi:hypothetical protein